MVFPEPSPLDDKSIVPATQLRDTKMPSTASIPSPPEPAVFATAELFCLILSHLDFRSLHQTTNVSHTWRASIINSPQLLRQLYLPPSYLLVKNNGDDHLPTRKRTIPRKAMTLNPFLYPPNAPVSLPTVPRTPFRPPNFTTLVKFLRPGSLYWDMHLTAPPCAEVSLAYEAWYDLPRDPEKLLSPRTVLRSRGGGGGGKGFALGVDSGKGSEGEDGEGTGVMVLKQESGVTVGALVEAVRGDLEGEGVEGELMNCFLWVRVEDVVVDDVEGVGTEDADMQEAEDSSDAQSEISLGGW